MFSLPDLCCMLCSCDLNILHAQRIVHFYTHESKRSENLIAWLLATKSLQLTQFLHQLLVLVQFLQSFCVHAWDVVGFRLVTMRSITKNTHFHLGPWDAP